MAVLPQLDNDEVCAWARVMSRQSLERTHELWRHVLLYSVACNSRQSDALKTIQIRVPAYYEPMSSTLPIEATLGKAFHFRDLVWSSEFGTYLGCAIARTGNVARRYYRVGVGGGNPVTVIIESHSTVDDHGITSIQSIDTTARFNHVADDDYRRRTSPGYAGSSMY